MLLGGCDAEMCPDISAGRVTPTPLETSAQRLSANPNIVQLVTAGDGLYWRDRSAIYARAPGRTEPVTLYVLPGPAPGAADLGRTESQPLITGLLADTDHLYWSEGSVDAGFDSGFVVGYSPGGRVLSMAKAGGDVHVLLDVPDRAVIAAGLDATRIIVKLDGVGAGYYAVDKLGGSPTRLAAPADYDSGRVVGDQIYWSHASGESSQVYRARFDTAEPEPLTRIEDSAFDVGPGYVLWRHDRLVTEPELLLDQNFMIWREGSGCVQALPGTGESISYATALDARYAYWHGFNALGSVSNSSDGTSSPLPEVPLLRIDLRSGAIARLQAPGFRSILGDQILGSDDQYVYLATADGLVALGTPR